MKPQKKRVVRTRKAPFGKKHPGGRPRKKSEKPREVRFSTLPNILKTLERFAVDFDAGKATEATLRAITYTGRACASILVDVKNLEIERRIKELEIFTDGLKAERKTREGMPV